MVKALYPSPPHAVHVWLCYCVVNVNVVAQKVSAYCSSARRLSLNLDLQRGHIAQCIRTAVVLIAQKNAKLYFHFAFFDTQRFSDLLLQVSAVW